MRTKVLYMTKCSLEWYFSKNLATN